MYLNHYVTGCPTQILGSIFSEAETLGAFKIRLDTVLVPVVVGKG